MGPDGWVGVQQSEKSLGELSRQILQHLWSQSLILSLVQATIFTLLFSHGLPILQCGHTPHPLQGLTTCSRSLWFLSPCPWTTDIYLTLLLLIHLGLNCSGQEGTKRKWKQKEGKRKRQKNIEKFFIEYFMKTESWNPMILLREEDPHDACICMNSSKCSLL